MDFKFNFQFQYDELTDTDHAAEKNQLKSINVETVENSLQINNITAHRSTTISLEDIFDDWNQVIADDVFSIESVDIENDFSMFFVQPYVKDLSMIQNHIFAKNIEPACESNTQSSVSKMHVTDISKTIPSLLETSDLVPNIYEGGLKVWECSIDLINFIRKQHINLSGKTVFDLGCGIGLLGICASNMQADHVIFQDFNEYVILKATGLSVLLNEWMKREKIIQPVAEFEKHNIIAKIEFNFHEIVNRKMLDNHKFKFIYGDWGTVTSCLVTKVDMILMAETIYDITSYEKLHNLIKEILKEDGIVYIAAKSFYFGVGGGLYQWIEFVKHKSDFNIEIVETINASLERGILKMWFRNRS